MLSEAEIQQLVSYGDNIVDTHTRDPASCKFGIEVLKWHIGSACLSSKMRSWMQVRSGVADDSWKVAFLNTNNACYEDGYSWLISRVKERLSQQDDWAHILPKEVRYTIREPMKIMIYRGAINHTRSDLSTAF